jgi:hypothetical protein
MFTAKFYSNDGRRQVIETAESFTILRGDGDDGAEITLHRTPWATSFRIDILPDNGTVRPEGWPPVYQTAIIENELGKTTEIIRAGPPART